MQRFRRSLWKYAGFVFVSLCLWIGLSRIGLAQDAEPLIVQLDAGETVELSINGYCLQREEPFPGPVLEYVGPVSDPIQVAIDYSLETTYIESDLYDTQLAVWELTDEIRPDFVGPVAIEVVEYALENPVPATAALDMPSITTLLDEGILTAEVVDYVNLTSPEFFGEGTLIITNESDEEVTFYIPTGVRFADPENGDTQDVAIFVAPRELAFAAVEFEAPEPEPLAIFCWDLDQDGIADDEEDINDDGVVDVLDCRGPVGPAGPRGARGTTGPAGPEGPAGPAGPPGPSGPSGPAGLACWDLNGNGTGEAEEDLNRDGVYDARDCQGPAGAVGPVGPVGPQGPVGPVGPVGPAGLVAVQQVTKSTPINNEPIKALSVECAADQIVVAGGYRLESPLPPNWFFMPVANFPSSPNVWTVQINAWFARIAPAGDCGCTDQWGFTAYAICVNPSTPPVTTP